MPLLTSLQFTTPNSSGNGSNLTNDIDSSLYGTWKDNTNGTTLTVTFASTGITWGGTSGSTINTTTSMYNGTGYSFVWVANNGAISYKYTYQGGQVQTMKVYGYRMSNGNLILSTGGTDFATLVKQQ